jgi:hypothetical protein
LSLQGHQRYDRTRSFGSSEWIDHTAPYAGDIPSVHHASAAVLDNKKIPELALALKSGRLDF